MHKSTRLLKSKIFNNTPAEPLVFFCDMKLCLAVQRSRPPWPPARSLRLGECDGRCQGDQPSAIKKHMPWIQLLEIRSGPGVPS